MKKFTFCTVITMLLFCGVLQSQTTKGKVLLGVSSALGGSPTTAFITQGTDFVNIGFTTVKSKSDHNSYDMNKTKGSNIQFAPRLGYLIMDNLAVGLDMSLSFVTQKFDGSKLSSNAYSVGPFARYYFPTEKVLPFVELSAHFGRISQEWNIEDDPYKISARTIGGGAGLAVFVGNHLIIDILAGYDSSVFKARDDNPDNERTTSAKLGFNVGCTLLLGK